MRILKRPTVKFILQVAMPAMLIVLAALFAGRVILSEMAQEVDRSERRSVERAVNAALTANLRRLGDVHSDYAVWDDAVRAFYGTVDMAFAQENVGNSTRQGQLFDTAYLIGDNDETLFGFRNGQPVLRSALDEFGPAISALIRDVRHSPGPLDARTGYLIDRSGTITAVAIGSVRPMTSRIPQPLGPARLMLLGRTLDDSELRRMSLDFVIAGLALSDQKPGRGPSITIHDPQGQPLGYLVWTQSRQGFEAFHRVLPTAYLAVALVCLTMFFLLAIGYLNLVELRRREQHALFSANHDALTGLMNRAALVRVLEAATAQFRRVGTPVALLYLDLDGFKEVNDSYGHDAGDHLLRHVAARFTEICEEAGLLARFGGDEFAVVIQHTDSVAQAIALSDRLIRFFDQPIDIQGHSIALGTSVGVAVLDDESVTADELLRRADVAMYLAKELGRNRVAFYDPSIDAARAERMRLADELRQALREENLAVVYQPIFDAATMRPTGVEALVRWIHPEEGLIPPDVFVPVAEESGIIDQIGTFVLERACRDALDWPNVRLSVNVSPVQMRNPHFDTTLAAIAARTGFPIERLEIEMTETHLVSSPERTQSIIASLRGRGVTIALDDFGTGYSSIGYLRRFTFDKLKLDRSLVAGITTDRAARQLCEATLALARALHLEVTAEGVETEGEADVLRQAGCDHLQGYAFARPMSADAVGSFLHASVLPVVVLPWGH